MACFGGCGPCGYGNNNYYGNGFNRGYGNNFAKDGYAARNADVVCNSREVYYEKDNCYRARDAAVCGNNEVGCCGGYDNGCVNGGCSSYGGCGPVGCGPVGCADGFDDGYGPMGGYVDGYGRKGHGKHGGYKGHGTPSSKLHKNLGHNVSKRSGWTN